jgi:hypothetical protein
MLDTYLSCPNAVHPIDKFCSNWRSLLLLAVPSDGSKKH